MKISFMIGHISHAAQTYNNMHNYNCVCVFVWQQLIYALLAKFDVPSLSLTLFTLKLAKQIPFEAT